MIKILAQRASALLCAFLSATLRFKKIYIIPIPTYLKIIPPPGLKRSDGIAINDILENPRLKFLLLPLPIISSPANYLLYSRTFYAIAPNS